MRGVAVIGVLAGVAAVAQTELQTAARDPFQLAKFLESHGRVDWKSLSAALHLDRGDLPACGDGIRAPCAVELISLVSPEQTVLLAPSLGGDTYLRYLRTATGWNFAGSYSSEIRNYPRRHEVDREHGIPLLKVSGQGNRGSGIDSESEDWFDLSLPTFEPMFSFLPQGESGAIFTYWLSRRFRAFASMTGRDEIAVRTEVGFSGDRPVREMGRVSFEERYRREPGGREFKRTSAKLVGEAVTDAGGELDSILTLAGDDQHPEPTQEDLIRYDFSGLREIALRGSVGDKAWLRLSVSKARPTAEVLELRRLLSDPR